MPGWGVAVLVVGIVVLLLGASWVVSSRRRTRRLGGVSEALLRHEDI